jgi:hypothetical protein
MGVGKGDGRMGLARNWTAEEETQLSDMWGETSIGTISKKLGRSRNAVIVRKNRMGLGAFTQCGDYVTLNELYKTLYGRSVNSYEVTSWIRNRNFPIRYQRVEKNRFRVVNIDDFWEWAEKNSTLLDFSQFEKYSLGAEPEWVDAKRRSDRKRSGMVTTKPWTKAEDKKLERLLAQQRYTYYEMSRHLGRTCGAIQRRIIDLGLGDRPVKAYNHIKWTKEEIDTLNRMIKGHENYETISEAVGRSSKAVRGIVYRLYNTENLDKAREVMDKEAGDNGSRGNGG